MNNISNIKDCYGCGICAIVCPRKIVDVKLNKSGFYEPYITDMNNCIDCGLCMKVCSYSVTNLSAFSQQTPKAYAAWSNDSNVRSKCSSGGISFELGRHLIAKGYKVCGVRYNAEKNRAEHYVASNIEELLPSIGSKYIQSYTVDGFMTIDRKKKYLVTGTPCQIDSFRRYIKRFKVEENFVLMDFFCHGVPSMLMWNKYLDEVRNITGKVSSATWRNKKYGWHDSYNLIVIGENGCRKSRLSQGDIFFGLFLNDVCLCKACYDKCKYKLCSSAADIRIGDFWGTKYKMFNEGVCAVLTFTPKGDAILKEMDSLTLEPNEVNIVTEGQMKGNASRPILSRVVGKMLQTNCSINLFRPILFFLRIQKSISIKTKKINENRNNNLS